MERISYQVECSFIENLLVQFMGFWLYGRSRIYLGITFVVCMFLAILVTEGFALLAICMLCYLLGMWSLCFFHRIECAIDLTFRDRKGEGHVNYIDKEKGLGFNTEDSGGWLGWKEFMYIRETKRFFFLQYKTGEMNVVLKKTLSENEILSLRKILLDSPVKIKFLYPV